ncbi:hypothetical protein AMTRI_Chr03g143100 [Amborella trichopoda]
MLTKWLISSCKISSSSLFCSLLQPFLSLCCRPLSLLKSPHLVSTVFPLSPSYLQPEATASSHSPSSSVFAQNRRQPEAATPFLPRSIFPLPVLYPHGSYLPCLLPLLAFPPPANRWQPENAATISHHLSSYFSYPLLTPRPSRATFLYFSNPPCCSLSLKSQQQSLPLYFNFVSYCPLSLLSISLAL